MRLTVLGRCGIGRRAVRRAILLLLAAAPARAQEHEPAAVFLTWSGDPTTTVTVDWHQLPGTDLRQVQIRGPGHERWTAVEGQAFPFPFSTRMVRRALVTGLRPDATYEIRFDSVGRVFRYRTMPSRLTRPVRFAAGGDTRASEDQFGRMNRIAAQRDVDFVMFGGDLAYSNGSPRLVTREEAWFETVSRTLVTADGRLIPVLAAIGNHEVFSRGRDSLVADTIRQQYGVRPGDSPYYSALIAMPRNHRYDVVDVGDYLSVVLLNTGHTAAVAGEQTRWLERVLRERQTVSHVFPIYHVPGYPSVRATEGATSKLVREYWGPLFERYGVRIAFENHDHVYKRTVSLRSGARHADGVVYIGDGSWGVEPRAVGRDQGKPAWYLARAVSVNHGIFVTLDSSGSRLEMVDVEGRTFDEYAPPPRAMAPSRR